MQRLIPYRLLVATIWGILLVTIAVCGIGLYLTVQQYRDMRETLLGAEKRAADNQIRQLQASLAREETAALAALVDSDPEDASLPPHLERHPFLTQPFVISADGTVFLPHLRRRNVPAMFLEEEVQPAGFEDALRLSLSRASLEDKLDRLERVYRSPELDAAWRLRARLNMAALHRRHGDARAASAIYRSVLGEFRRFLERRRWPSLLHVSLAYAESLGELGERDDAVSVLRRTIRGLDARDLRPTLEEEDFFLERCRELFARLSLPVPEELRRAESALAGERLVISDTGRLRDSIQDRVRLESESPLDPRPQHLLTFLSGRRIPAVWTRLAPSPGGGRGPLAVGFRIDTDGLLRFLEDRLSPGVQAQALEVAGAETDPATFEAFAAFPGDLGFIRVGLPKDAWERLVGQNRRPFVFAGALLALLGVILLSSLMVIFRGVKREYTLSRMKTEFVANVSHELKTPLSLVRLCGETLLLGRLRDQAQSRRYLEVITRESERLSHLITNMLDFASIESGKKTYQLDVIDILQVVHATLENYRFQLEEQGFDYSEDLPDFLPPVRADEEAVVQALVNLIQNAVRYSTDVRRIEVSARAAGNRVMISVRDYGVGIDPEDRKKIWDDYYRAAQARALGTRGSGLGLSVVQHILEAHGGSVELASEPGRGSTFTLVFPVAQEAIPEVSDEREDPRH